MKKGHSALSLKKRLDNWNANGHAQINKKIIKQHLAPPFRRSIPSAVVRGLSKGDSVLQIKGRFQRPPSTKATLPHQHFHRQAQRHMQTPYHVQRQFSFPVQDFRYDGFVT